MGVGEGGRQPVALVALGGINSGVDNPLSAEVATVIFSGSSWVSAEDSEVPEVSSSSLDRGASFSCAGGCATIHHWPVLSRSSLSTCTVALSSFTNLIDILLDSRPAFFLFLPLFFKYLIWTTTPSTQVPSWIFSRIDVPILMRLSSSGFFPRLSVSSARQRQNDINPLQIGFRRWTLQRCGVTCPARSAPPNLRQ